MEFRYFFVGTVNPVLAGVETDHPEAELYGEKIMDRTKEDIVSLMKKNGHTKYEVENEEYSGDGDEKDLRVSYESSMMDFFLETISLFI